jgi:two-component system, response regulator
MNQNLILLVEDNPDDEALTLRALNKNHITNPVVVVRDGVQAIDFLFGKGEFVERDTSIKPLVVILDLKLPRMNGLEVLEAIRSSEQTRTQPVVILTSSDEEQDIIQSYAEGVNSYVRKPVDFDEFLKSVGILGTYWAVVNEPPIDRPRTN